MPRLFRFIPAAALVVILQAACAASVTVSPPAGTTPSPSSVASAGQSVPASQPGTETPPVESPAGSADLDVGPGTFFMTDQRAGLAGLSSYTQTLTVSFDGTKDGTATRSSTVNRLQHIGQPPKSVLTVTGQGDIAPIDPAALAEWSGTAYQSDASGSCSFQPLDPDGSMLALAEPAGRLPVLLGADEAEAGQVGGTPVEHYIFDGRALLEPAVATTGEVWVASDGGYVVKFARTTTAGPNYFGGGLDGTKSWEYALTDINALTDVPLPDGCQLDAPVMAGATNILALPRYTGFDTQATLGDVIAYYKEQLPALGWEVKSEPFKEADRAAVEFAKGDQVMNLLITPGGAGLRVDLTLGSGA